MKLLCIVGALVWSSMAQAALPVQHWQTSQGARVYWMESPQLPMLDVRVDFEGGSRLDPAAKAGLAQGLSLMLSKGVAAAHGQSALNENELAERWADLAAQNGFSAESDRFVVSLRTLTKPEILNPAIDLLAQQLSAPSWPSKIWQREQSKIVAALREADTRPATQAEKAFNRAVFGEHPYGAFPTPASMAAVRVDDMKRVHGQIFQACHARVSMVGAITRAQAQTLAERLLQALPSGCSSVPPVAPVLNLKGPVEKNIAFDSAQTQVLIGQPGIARRSPDFFAFLVGNHILGGGGFASRLTEAVREKEGLTYSIYSNFNPLRERGAFEIGFQTRPDQARKALKITQQVLQDFVAKGPSAKELQAAKDNLTGGFASRMDSNAKLLGLLANIAWNDLPLDYLDTWVDQVNALSQADVQRAFQTIHPDQMVVVTVGQAQ